MALGAFNAIFLKGSPHEIWAVSHMTQLLLLLPLISKSMHNKVADVIVADSYFSFTMYSLPLSIIHSIPYIGSMSNEQQNDYLWKLGTRSLSVVVNNFVLIGFLILTVITHCAIAYIYRRTKRLSNKAHRFVRIPYRILTFSLYIRILIETSTISIILAMIEFKEYLDTGTNRTSAWIGLILSLAYPLFIFIHF